MQERHRYAARPCAAHRSMNESQPPSLSKRADLITANDQVIQQTNVDERQCLVQPARKLLVEFGGLWNAGGVVVVTHNTNRGTLEREFDDLCEGDACAVHPAAKEFLDRNKPVMAVQKDDAEDFMI